MVGPPSTARPWMPGEGESVGYDGFKHGKGSKAHACVDEGAVPLSAALSPGNEHDSRRPGEPLEGLSDAPRELYADSAYDSEPIRGKPSSMGVEANVPVNPRRGRMPRPYNADLYKSMRSAVERSYAWLKAFRRIAIRYERLAVTYKALINVAFIVIHLRMGNEN